MHVEDMRGDGSINLDTVASRLENAGKRVNENDNLWVRSIKNDEQHVEARQKWIWKIDVTRNSMAVIVAAIYWICGCHYTASSIQRSMNATLEIQNKEQNVSRNRLIHLPGEIKKQEEDNRVCLYLCNSNSLLLHNFVDCDPVWIIHFVKLVNTHHSSICKNHCTRLLERTGMI